MKLDNILISSLVEFEKDGLSDVVTKKFEQVNYLDWKDVIINVNEINDQYWVRSGRTNSRYEFPMVPVQKNLAELMKTYRNIVQELPGKDNPKKLLFIRYKGNKGVGKQILVVNSLTQQANRKKNLF